MSITSPSKYGFAVRIVRTFNGEGGILWVKERFWRGCSLVDKEQDATIYPSANAAYHAKVKFTDQLHPYISRDIVDLANGNLL